MNLIRFFRSFGNSCGLAWWAKVETNKPEVTYWFGPFLTKRSLHLNLLGFEDDLSGEGSKAINHSLIRCRKAEPLTS